MKKYSVRYRDEFEVEVEAEGEEEALETAKESSNWQLITGDGHADMFEVIDISKL